MGCKLGEQYETDKAVKGSLWIRSVVMQMEIGRSGSGSG